MHQARKRHRRARRWKDCTPASVERLAKAGMQLKGLSEETMRALRDQHENERRCLTVRKAMKSPRQ
ncbi:hypothetical protein F2P44_02645 [Massilia sp. CCM 8695]|uniref:DUF3606 domain-containing protein n=1 Tax=Massilia frigida TaxID=2609281 RepID=A0ABX0NCK4_9BURK|nr:hypothetical protein [Massilia frigida]NHZ78190.1 hypothetical protein [Massilia frigida]